MPESFKTQRYEERESSKLGIADYFKSHVLFGVLPPFIGGAIGLGLRKVTKLPALEKFSNPLGLFMSKQGRAEFQKLVAQGGQFAMRRGEAWGLGIGAMISAFHLWSTNTKQQLEVDKITKDVEALREMESGNAYLKKESEQLQRQIKFTDRHASRGVSHVDHAAESKEAANEVAR